MRNVIADGVELVVDHTLCHLIYNSQPHIDEFETGVDRVVPNDGREEKVYYALLHKHYHLNPGEIIVAEFAEDSHTTRVEKLTENNWHYEPCLWYPRNGRYYAVMFSASKLVSEITPPSRYRADVGLMHPDYAYPWTEFTDAAERSQSFILDYRDDSATRIVTVVWRVPDVFARCASTCYANCYKPAVGKHQKGPHVKTHSRKDEPEEEQPASPSGSEPHS